MGRSAFIAAPHRGLENSAMVIRHNRQFQHGAALLVFLVLVVMAALTIMINRLPAETVDTLRQEKTAAVLAQARDALLGYMQTHRDRKPNQVYGYLPLPDLGSSRNQNLDPTCLGPSGIPLEGCDANFFTGLSFDANGVGPTVVGRFPWRTLGIEPLRDGHGECLWLIVSSLHSRIQRATPPPQPPALNWDTPGQLDVVVADGTASLNSILASPHDRPVAIVFAPGPPLPGQDRSASSTDDVTQCGGNYNAANYLDPAIASALGGITNYLGGTNAASGNTGDSDPANDPDAAKPTLTEGKVFSSAGNYLPNGCTAPDCNLLANDMGLPITPDELFAAIRRNANFRTDINSLLDRIVGCLRDEIAAGNSPGNGKIAGADNNSCYGQDVPPLAYYPNWREMIFTAAPATVNGVSCAGALLFAGQRGPGQIRISPADKSNAANYLEGSNLTAFTSGTHNFIGPMLFDQVGPSQTADQDIVRCIPAGASMNTVTSPALATLGGQIVAYDPATRTLTLGRQFSISRAQRAANSSQFFGCSWTPEAHPLGSGLRSYFKFRILDRGEGFTFAIIDGDRNGANVCGAAGSHLGYSGNNGTTPRITEPKIGFEIDTTRQTFRNDPFYAGGHFGIVYWGDTPETDDNVHGIPAMRAGLRPDPQNPPAPATPTPGTGVYKLDANLSSTPLNQDIHVRVELTRLDTDNNDHSTRWLLEAWLLKDSATTANQIAAMKNTTRPMAQLSPGFSAHIRDTPTFFDPLGGTCTTDADCAPGHVCSAADQQCYAPVLKTVRLGFTNSQSTPANDQLITISDFFTTWLP
ncbi:MAG: hypothetical protein ACK4R8_10395 [Thiobacillus sp.]